MQQVKAKVVKNIIIEHKRYERRLAPDIIQTQLIWLECPEIAREAKPGQFVLVRCGDSFLPRPFSIHKVENDTFALYFAALERGKGTGWLAEREPGEDLLVIGPSGNKFSVHNDSRNLLMVAGGMGIAPLIFLAQAAVNKGHSVTVLYGTANNSRYRANFIPRRANLVAATDDGSIGYKGLVTDLIPKHIDWADQVFTCGPLAMYKDMARRRKELLKDKPCQISLEMRMACGHGVCYGCTIETKQGLKQVCKDGPVFNLDDVENILRDDELCTKWLTV